MKTVTHDIVAKLWNFCNVLKDDGVTYHQYVTELTYLLFLKMAKETDTESQIPRDCRWERLKGAKPSDRLKNYRNMLFHLGTHGSALVREIFAGASSFIKKPSTLSLLVSEIDNLDWYSAAREGLGDLYEGLLEKNANEKKSGAGQYFTPRPLIDCLVELMQPSLNDIVQDPAAGTGGFLISAHRYVRAHTSKTKLNPAKLKKLQEATFFGMEHVQDTHRLALMNLMLHGIDSNPRKAGIRYGDTLSSEGRGLPPATLILSNPPFGSKKGGGLPTRGDLPFPTSNKQLCFLQHIYLGLTPRGRAAVIVPDNVLFENSVAKQIRTDLMAKCNLHTILRLPTGLFYAQGVKTNVLFFARGISGTSNTRELWIYDFRSNLPPFGRRRALKRSDLFEFENAFGKDPHGGSMALAVRQDTGMAGRFRRFSREEIAARHDNLDITWLNDGDKHGTGDPSTLAQQAIDGLDAVSQRLRAILVQLKAA